MPNADHYSILAFENRQQLFFWVRIAYFNNLDRWLKGSFRGMARDYRNVEMVVNQGLNQEWPEIPGALTSGQSTWYFDAIRHLTPISTTIFILEVIWTTRLADKF